MTAEKNQNIKDNVFYNLSFFHNDEEILFLYQKIERISGAIFLVTRLIEDSTIIKRTIQEAAIVSFKDCASLVSSPDITTEKLKKVSLDLSALYAYLDSAFWSGLLSHMNSSVIQKEIHTTVNLISRLDEKYKNASNPKNSFLSLLETRVSVVESGTSVKDSTVTVKDTQKDIIKDIKKDTKIKDAINEDRVAKIKALMRDLSREV